MRLVALVVIVAAAIGTPAVAAAIDHKNLDESRPLHVEDAYPIASGEWAVEAGAGGTFPRRGPNRAVFPVEVLYGVVPNLHVSLGTQLSTDPRSIEEQTRSGDLHRPASSRPAVELKGIVTKSVGSVSFHGNAGGASVVAPRPASDISWRRGSSSTPGSEANSPGRQTGPVFMMVGISFVS